MPVHKNLCIKIISVGISYNSKISEAFKMSKNRSLFGFFLIVNRYLGTQYPIKLWSKKHNIFSS